MTGIRRNGKNRVHYGALRVAPLPALPYSQIRRSQATGRARFAPGVGVGSNSPIGAWIARFDARRSRSASSRIELGGANRARALD